MKGYFWQTFIPLARLLARRSQALICLRRVGKSMRKLITYFAPFTVVACAGGPGYIEISTY